MRKTVSREYLESSQQTLVRDALRVIKEARTLLDATERCLISVSPAFPLYTPDLLKAINVLYQLAGCHSHMANVLRDPR